MSNEGSVNLCSKYILPLLGLNIRSFDSYGTSRFVNSYVSQDDNYVIVESTHPFSAVIVNMPSYCFSMTKEKNHLAVFEVPAYYKEDVKKFRRGAYSKLSDSAKNLIKNKSGMTNRVKNKNGKYDTAIEILALDRDPKLKEYWEEKIGVTLPADAELLDIPNQSNFFDLNITNKLETA